MKILLTHDKASCTNVRFASFPELSFPIYLSSHFTCVFGCGIQRKKQNLSHFHFCLFHYSWKNILQHQQKEFPQEKLPSFGPKYLLLLLLPPYSPHCQSNIWILHVPYRCCHSFPLLHCYIYLLNKIWHLSAKLIHLEENEWKKRRKRSQEWERGNNMKEKWQVRRAKWQQVSLQWNGA